MRGRDPFSSYHPVVNFVYFALVLVFTMFFTHPAPQMISLLSAVIYAVRLNGRGASLKIFCFVLPMALIAAVINPAFSHEGNTILGYFPTGNPLTLESILYGISASVLIAAVMVWFSCYTAVMTSDKFIYLFGKVIPALSLVLSMTLRFVPKFKRQMEIVTDAQRCLGRDVSQGSVWQRVRTAITILSILVTWSLENAIETADSMKSRGYGLPGRTAFSIYRFDSRDKTALCWLAFCGFFIFSSWMTGGFYWRYYPTIKAAPLTPMTVFMNFCYLALCITPVILGLYEDLEWQKLSESEGAFGRTVRFRR